MYITIKRTSTGYLEIEDSYGNFGLYLYYTKREALKKFKEKNGYKYKRNIEIKDYTAGYTDILDRIVKKEG